MAGQMKISLPLWLVARAEDVNVNELNMATFKDSQSAWMNGNVLGKTVLMAFTSRREANQFVIQHFANQTDYVNAELEAEQLILVLDACDSAGIQAVRINNKHTIPLARFQRWVGDQIIYERMTTRSPVSLDNLEVAERQVYSQNGEDGVIEAIFATIGVTNRYFVEFGCEDGSECNAAYLLNQGWRGLWMDASYESHDPIKPIRKELVTAENIDALLRKYQVPHEFDLLSIDIDGNDFWVWKAIEHRPRVVVIEYNAHFAPPLRSAMRYDPHFQWEGTSYYGASLVALAELGRLKGYTLVYCEWAGVNAFFIADELLPDGYLPRAVESIFRGPNYFYLDLRWPHDKDRTMIDPFTT